MSDYCAIDSLNVISLDVSLIIPFPFGQYVQRAVEKIKNTSHWEVDVEVEKFHVKGGANRLNDGLFVGKTLIYADLNHIILRITPKYESEAKQNSVLVSSHIDTVFSTYVCDYDTFQYSFYFVCDRDLGQASEIEFSGSPYRVKKTLIYAYLID